VYIASTAEETDFEVTLLRSGLPILDSQDSEDTSDGETNDRFIMGDE
jgi:hypothetical protein